MRNILFAGIIFFAGVFNAQVYSFKQFTKSDGLPSAYIYDIQQDVRGFLAIATGDGLSYYEGFRFTTLDTANGLSDNIISCLTKNSKGEIVVGHIKNGLSKQSSRGFESINRTRSIESPVNCVLYVEESILFGTRNGFLGLIKNDSVQLIKVPEATFINKILNANGVILIATDNGIYQFKQDNSLQLIKSTEGIHYTSLANYDNKQVLAGTEDGELYIYKLTNSQIFLLKISSSIICKNLAIKSIINTTSNRLLIASWGNGIYYGEIDIVTQQLKNLKNIGSANGLASMFVNVILKDFDDNIWIGTFGGGLYKLNNTHFRVYNEKSGLSQNRVRAVLALENKIYLGLDNGLQVLDILKDDSLIVYNSKNKFKDVRVTSLAKVSEFNLIVGTEKNGLYLFDIKKQSFTDYFQKTKLNNSPKAINHVYFSKDSVAYISTLDGLFINDLKTGKVKKLTTDERLPHNNIQNTFLDSENNLWFVAPKSVPGLIKNDTIVLYKDIPDYSSYNPTSVCEGRNGAIYITTKGDGIYKYSKGVFTQYTVKNGLLSNYVLNAIYDKNKGKLICMHQSGFSVFDLTKSRISATASKTSLNAFESSVNSIALNNSTVYFGTEEGLGVYKMDEEKTRCAPPKNTLLGLKINKKPYSPQDSIIYLPYSHYDLQFNYIGVELTNPDQVLYTYKLSGFDKNFKTTSERQLEYYKLTEGVYKLIIYSINYLGVRNHVPLQITIVIDKPIYKKWWFICLIILALIAIVYISVRLKTRQLRKQSIILKKKIDESTEDILRMNKDLEIKNKDIRSSIDYAKRIQEVLLPKRELIMAELDAFIFYQPKDIVSGDFYWFHKTEKFIYIAVVDCTGHGVPGAFMSIIGSSFLDQILAESKNPLPSHIVTQLDHKIVQSLRQGNDKDGVADGMDAALCRIDLLNQEIIFCGANRPIYIVSKGELIEYRSNRLSIGGFRGSLEREFKDDIHYYAKGDTFYIFSDGYVDQFGLDPHRRFGTKRVKELTTGIGHLEINEQLNEIETQHNIWKKTLSQTDDVLMIGVKL